MTHPFDDSEEDPRAVAVIATLTRDLAEARATLAELTQRLDPYVERNHDDGGTHAEALDSLIADAVRYSEAVATLDAMSALVGGGDVVERCRQITAERRDLLSSFLSACAVNIPADEDSSVSPSLCPFCGEILRAFDHGTETKAKGRAAADATLRAARVMR